MSCGTKQTARQGTATINTEEVRRKQGRPRVIGESLIPKILSLYRSGLRYRAIARELGKEGVWVYWRTIRRTIKANQGRANENMASK